MRAVIWYDVRDGTEVPGTGQLRIEQDASGSIEFRRHQGPDYEAVCVTIVEGEIDISLATVDGVTNETDGDIHDLDHVTISFNHARATFVLRELIDAYDAFHRQ